ncbi:3',5'-cyclic-AMP phosphodiesterase [Hydrocarboniclastica marina]|uniref:3',5'-cyclic-AMP phosphodiesterase n=1 Tax=Hydrocarboniclastica marina TaxID=2259620 RepID=A0A4P7XFW1_9ALTE|nr:3',5'-cyclic-AMP phosphodiesterase [Hydrocarboniclastica marina]QCF25032.1 3',5'-cyclic-AMP phosphodiesterase [Hydrocarboniclastica marina]
MNTSGRALRILQITDCHLGRTGHSSLLGMDTRASFDSVLELVKQNYPEPDLVLATGDIGQDGSVEAYRYFQDKMSVFSCPVFWFAGNHDNFPAMLEVAGSRGALEKTFASGPWQLIFLNSAVPGKVHGFLRPKELSLLNRTLEATPDKFALIAFHHHPIDTDCQWLNPIGLRNREAFFATIDRYPQVRGVVWGHVHQEMDQRRGDVRLLAAPSTCIQFEPRSREFGVGRESPGYRWLELHPDGRIETGVVRADHIEFEVDMNSGGY